MNFDTFVNTYRGRMGLGTNPSDTNECLGLLNFGEQAMRGILYPIKGITYARDFGTGNNTRPDLYQWIANDPNNATQVPSKGDMIVWNNIGDVRGHVAYVIDAPQGVNSLQVFDQWQGAPAQIRTYTYNTCKGWWHIKTTPPPPPAINSNQRKVGPDGVKYRKEPNTNSGLLITEVIHDGIVDGGQIANLLGFVRGQEVDGNNTWFKGYSGGYMWSGAFDDPSTNGLNDLTPAAPPVTPPAPTPTYNFTKDLACVTEVIPAHTNNFMFGNFPDKPEKAVIHDFGTLGVNTYQSAVNWFKSPNAEVSAHFVVSGKKITQMVSLKDRAYHAGTNGNSFIGIETDPAQDQDTINSARTLLKELKAKYGYQLALVEHNQIPGAKTACGDDVDLANYDITPVEPPKPTDPPTTPVDPPKPVETPVNGSQTLLDVIKQFISKIIDFLGSFKRSK